MVGINIHKNIKLFYYTKNAVLQLIPRWFFRSRLDDMMRPKSEDDIDYLKNVLIITIGYILNLRFQKKLNL